MRNGKFLILMMCLAALTLAAQETRLAGPVSGVLFDPQARALRPILGVMGASYLGDAVVAGLDYASVSPNGKFAVAIRPDGVLLVRGLDEGRADQFALETPAGVTHAAWSADSSAVALWNDAGHVEAWRDLATTARLALSADLGKIVAVAVAADGSNLAAATEAGAIVLADGTAVRQILALERPAALALAGSRLFVADAARNEILSLANYAKAGDAQMFANGARGVSDPEAMAVSPDQKALLVAGKAARSLTAFDLSTSEILAVAELDFEPTRLERFSGSLFALTNGVGGVPFEVLDSTRSLAVYFVPAEPAVVVED